MISPELAKLAHVLTLQGGPIVSTVLLGAMALGLAAGVIGSFALLRDRSLLADTIAHSALPGIACAFLISTFLGLSGQSTPILLLGGLIAGALGSAFVQLLMKFGRVTEDAAMALVLSVMFGAGVVLMTVIQRLPNFGGAGLERFILGQTAALTQTDALTIGIVALMVVLCAGALFKDLTLMCFDAAYAKSIGRPVKTLDITLMVLIVTVTIVGLQAVGLVMVIALQIVPAATARLWSSQVRVMVVLAGVFGLVSCWLGVGLSALYPQLPAGAVVVLCAGAIFLASLFLSPSRGLLARGIVSARRRLHTNQGHALRAMFERAEAGNIELSTPLDPAVINMSAVTSASLRLAGLMTVDVDGRIRLTDLGQARATHVVRIHRLWESYLINRTSHDPAHVDLLADLLEHAPSETPNQNDASHALMLRLERELDLATDMATSLSSPHALELSNSTFPSIAQSSQMGSVLASARSTHRQHPPTDRTGERGSEK